MPSKPDAAPFSPDAFRASVSLPRRVRSTGRSAEMQPMADWQDHADPRHRRIRSFVLRQGRFTPAQQRAFEDHWEHYGLARDVVPNWNDVFVRHAQRVLEIGFG